MCSTCLRESVPALTVPVRQQMMNRMHALVNGYDYSELRFAFIEVDITTLGRVGAEEYYSRDFNRNPSADFFEPTGFEVGYLARTA